MISKTYKNLMQAIAYVAAGSFLVYYAALTVYAVNITIGWIFIVFGFIKAITSLMEEPPEWLERVDFALALVLFFGAVAFAITVVVRDVVMIQPLFVVIGAFIALLAIVQLIDITRRRRG